ncbi:Bardet-Biedl syndrome 12 protein isoform X2 [Marmota monax]|uniref:Bardet-Biedl syndrome 12 protein isoform X2 n=1 Tax=Marmota monax TaxID=9995 RepID=UPI0026EBB28B|nr:Bardet-Biedl syndrome 12 protein isoform X2 [Marmota monax]
MLKQIYKWKLDAVLRSWKFHCSQEAEAGGWQVQGQRGQLNEILSQGGWSPEVPLYSVCAHSTMAQDNQSYPSTTDDDL